MCGRYSLAVDLGTLKERFRLTLRAPAVAARYNIAPSQEAPVVLEEDGGRRLALMRWGLVPSWAKDPAVGSKLINARAETAAGKPAFRSSFERRRCLVPADGFYEWDKRTRAPVRYVLKSREPFALAGLWDEWTKGPRDGPLRTFTLLTTDANALVKRVHPRMPVILRPELERAWLDPRTPPEDLAGLLEPYDSRAMASYEVSRLLNSPKSEGPALVEPVQDAQPELRFSE